ncbi:MAG TPA: DUF4129 domain-containing protein [Planktothrix sp.]|jgi:hypothetical protein
MDYRDITTTIAEVARHYHYEKSPQALLFVQDLVEKVMRWIADILNQLRIVMPGMSDTRVVGNVMQIILFVAAALAVIAIVYFVFRRMSQINAQALLARHGQASSETMLDASSWRAQAEEMAGKGHWKEASRALYFSLLHHLSERGILEFVPTRTNYEYWYALARHKPIAVAFRQIADIVEESWFGYHEASKSDYEQCLQLLQQAESELDNVKAATT